MENILSSLIGEIKNQEKGYNPLTKLRKCCIIPLYFIMGGSVCSTNPATSGKECKRK